MGATRPEHPHFARFYERMIAGAEKAGLTEMRAELLSRASGRTLEIGAGTGLNLPLYTSAVNELVVAEPDPHMAKRLRERLADGVLSDGIDASVVEVSAEDLPFDDGSFDTVVSTLVLCTVESQARSLAEVEAGARRRWRAALPRAREGRRLVPRVVAGPPRAPVGLGRRRMPPQP